MCCEQKVSNPLLAVSTYPSTVSNGTINEYTKGSDSMLYILIEINSSKRAVAIPFSVGMMDAFMRSGKLVTINRTWDGKIESIVEVNEEFSISVVKPHQIQEKSSSKEARKAALEAQEDKIEQELAVLRKEKDSL